MDADDSRGAVCNRLRDTPGVDVVGSGINVDEDGLESDPFQGVCRGDKGEARHDDFAAQPESFRRKLQSEGPVTHGDSVCHAEYLTDALFELPDIRPVVRQPTTRKQILDFAQKGSLVGNVGKPNMEFG